jgi:hypothetical protein
MTIYKEFRVGGQGGGPFSGITALLGLAIFFVALYFIAKGLFTFLAWASPVLLIGAAILDYTVLIDFGKFLIKLVKDNPVMGIITLVLSVMGYPILFGYLFFKALMRRQLNKIVKEAKKEPTYSEYEDVTEVEDEDFLELPQMEKPKATKSGSEYDELFK